MNIVRAGAYSNDAGVIVDSFQFTDIFRTIELNPTEKTASLPTSTKLSPKKSLSSSLLNARRHLNQPGNYKLDVPTKLDFDSESHRIRLSCKSSRRTCLAFCARSLSSSAPISATSR